MKSYFVFRIKFHGQSHFKQNIPPLPMYSNKITLPTLSHKLDKLAIIIKKIKIKNSNKKS